MYETTITFTVKTKLKRNNDILLHVNKNIERGYWNIGL